MPGRFVLVLVLAGLGAACERRVDAGDDEGAEPRLTLTIETPETLDWGGTGVLRLTLANEGDAVAEGGIVEIYVPNWLEFGTTEPSGTEVFVTSGNEETRLAYPLTDSLPPGERRTVLQHLRVQYAPPPPPLPTDTVETVNIAPMHQTVRARLLTPDGRPAGVEIQATLNFVGGTGTAPPLREPPLEPAVRDTVVGADTAGTGRDTIRNVRNQTRAPMQP
jgi:hypothetical protein